MSRIHDYIDEIRNLRRRMDTFRYNIRHEIDNSKVLNQKEKKILRWRYCFRKTLDEIGKEYGVGRERIRQIEAKGLEKMKYETQE